MKIIPVMDIKNGMIVHAVAGRRNEYKPLKESILIDKPHPRLLLAKLRELGFDEIYIADLDAITGAGSNYQVIKDAVNMGFKVLADVGINGLYLSDNDSLMHVIGTEYLARLELANRRAMSLDMIGGRVLLGGKLCDLDDILVEVRRLQLKSLIVISLDRVGTLAGPDLDSVRAIREAYNGRLLIGGGIRNIDDLEALKNVGVDGVLIATALHRGTIMRREY